MNEGFHERRAEAGRPPSAHDWARRAITLLVVVAGIAVGFIYLFDAFSSAALFLLILIALVMAHEAGHFFTAKAFGIYVHEFGLGFPPRVAAFKYGETEYSLNWLPIGGFVRLEGEEQSEHPRSLSVRPRWQRLIVLASGAVVNLILPVFLFALALSFPHEVAVGRASISTVVPDSPAEAAGLQEGDVIYTIAGRRHAQRRRGEPLHPPQRRQYRRHRVRRDGEFITIPVDARRSPPVGQGPTGSASPPPSSRPTAAPSPRPSRSHPGSRSRTASARPGTR